MMKRGAELLCVRRRARARLGALLLSPLFVLFPAVRGEGQESDEGGREASVMLRAGAARVKVTPSVEPYVDANGSGRFDPGEPFSDLDGDETFDAVWMAGITRRNATGVHDDLWASGLAIEAGGKLVVLCVCDVLGIPGSLADRVAREMAAELGITAGSILVGSCHNHQSPDTLGFWGASPFRTGQDPAFLDRLRAGMKEAIRGAVGALRPAELRAGAMRLPDEWFVDHREPRDWIPEVPILEAREVGEPAEPKGGQEARGARTIAVLAVVHSHVHAIEDENLLLASDMPHYFRARVEAVAGGMAFLCVGAEGGHVMPAVPGGRHDFSGAQEVGEGLARRVLDALPALAPVPPSPWVVASARFRAEVRNPLLRGAAAIGLFPAATLWTTENLSDDMGTLVAGALGPIRFATVPGEAFPEVGREILSKFRARTVPFLLGSMNNHVGYFVPDGEFDRDAYRRGCLDPWGRSEWGVSVPGYHELTSLGPRVTGQLLDQAGELIARVESSIP